MKHLEDMTTAVHDIDDLVESITVNVRLFFFEILFLANKYSCSTNRINKKPEPYPRN